jgi:hypothetical protein
MKISAVEPWFRSVSVEQFSMHMVKVQLKQILYRSGQTLRVPGGFEQLAHEGDKVVSPKHWLPLLPRKYS